MNTLSALPVFLRPQASHSKSRVLQGMLIGYTSKCWLCRAKVWMG